MVLSRVGIINVFRSVDIDPRIRGLVVWLRDMGFETCDSGDGVSKFEDRSRNEECELDYPHVFIHVSPETLLLECNRLWIALVNAGLRIGPLSSKDIGKRLPGVVGRYEPGDYHSFIELVNVTTDMVPGIIDS